jgi:Ser/Thr protein kinase RdoA (MazF antagonist)
MLTQKAAGALAEQFGLDADAHLEGPVARGQLGQVWRLRGAYRSVAVKEWFAGPDPADAARDAAFSELVRSAGVFTPSVIHTVAGEVTTVVDGTMVRAYEWVDLEPHTRGLDPAAVGEAVAKLHLATSVAPPVDGPVDRWFSDGFGAAAWCALLEQLVEAGAPFAPDLAPLVRALIEVESVIEPHERPILCHRDLWADNVLGSTDGLICVIDFENMGPADPSQELAMVLYEFGDDNPGRALALHTAYVAAGGPGRVTRSGHFTMLIAEQAHIAHLAASRWIGESDTGERARLEAWFRELLDDPVTLPRIQRVLASVI